MLPTESVRRLSKNRSKVKKTTHVKIHCLRAIQLHHEAIAKESRMQDPQKRSRITQKAHALSKQISST